MKRPSAPSWSPEEDFIITVDGKELRHTCVVKPDKNRIIQLQKLEQGSSFSYGMVYPNKDKSFPDQASSNFICQFEMTIEKAPPACVVSSYMEWIKPALEELTLRYTQKCLDECGVALNRDFYDRLYDEETIRTVMDS